MWPSRAASASLKTIRWRDRDHPGLVLIYKVRTREEQYENAYHCDTTWRECPQFGAVLRCTEAPEVGGDMIWCNMVMAYERLRTHQITDRWSARSPQHRGDVWRGDANRKEAGAKGTVSGCRAPRRAHHPETGEKALFVNAFTTHFTNFHTPQNVRFGQDYAPGAANLLSYLISQAYVPEYQVRRRLRKNTVAIWDNRCTQHYAVQDLAGGTCSSAPESSVTSHSEHEHRRHCSAQGNPLSSDRRSGSS